MPVGRTLQTLKITNPIRPQAQVDNDDPVGAKDDANPVAIDTIGFNSCCVLWSLGASDVAPVEMNVFECDTSGGTYTEIGGVDWKDDTILTPTTDDNVMYATYLDLRDKKRYLKIDSTMGDGSNGTYITVHVILADPDIVPNTAAERGLQAECIDGTFAGTAGA